VLYITDSDGGTTWALGPCHHTKHCFNEVKVCAESPFIGLFEWTRRFELIGWEHPGNQATCILRPPDTAFTELPCML
jgi:hypothetical protein